MQFTVDRVSTQTDTQTRSDGAPTQQLDQDAFLKLLMAQLRYQDPLKPMEDKDFLAQTAQFNSLSQMSETNQSLQSLLALQSLAGGADFIGKHVEVADPETGDTAKGTVVRVVLRGGALSLAVQPDGGGDSREYPASAVTAIGQPA